MSDAEFSLECDDISFISSLSGNDIMYDLLSVGEHSSAGKYEPRCQIELEEMIANFNSNHHDLSHLRSFGAFLQTSSSGTLSEEVFEVSTFETRTEEFSLVTSKIGDVSIIVSVVDCESTSDEVSGEEEFEEASQDSEILDDIGELSWKGPLAQNDDIPNHSQLLASVSETTLGSADGTASNRITNGNVACYNGSNERIRRARARRFQALERYQEVIHSTSTHSSIRHELSLDEQIVENIRPTSPSCPKTPLVFRSQQIALSPETTKQKSLTELRSRQQQTLQDLICAFDKVRKNRVADDSTRPGTWQETRQPRKVRRLWSLNPAGRWKKR